MKKVSLSALILLIVASVCSIRNLAVAAAFGPALIFFFIFGALIFLVPTALISAELSAAYPQEGGIYHWVRKAFGDRWGMLAIWLQWISTLIWAPTILAFIAGVLSYVIHPELIENKTYLITTILILFWSLTIVNLFGVRTSAKISAFCGTIGTLAPIGLLIFLGILWIIKDHPLQIHLTPTTLFDLGAHSWVSLVAIMTSFTGIELAGVHVTDIQNPQRNFPKAILLASSIILGAMTFGALAIAFVLPSNDINLIAGSIQAIDHFFIAFGQGWLTPIIIFFIALGSIGGLINWVISPAKGLLHAAEFGFLPPFLRKKNKHGVASNILLIQAIAVSLLCSFFLFLPNVSGSYWFLMGLSTELYMTMYVLMFLSAPLLRKKRSTSPFRTPGGTLGLWIMVLTGLTGTLLTIFICFIPPPIAKVSGPLTYAIMITLSNLIALFPLPLLFKYQKKPSGE